MKNSGGCLRPLSPLTIHRGSMHLHLREDASLNSLRSGVADAHQDISFPKKAKLGSLNRNEKAERERKQREGRQLLTNFFQKKGEHSSQLTQFKNSES